MKSGHREVVPDKFDVLFPSDHRDGRDVDGVQTLQSLPGNAQEPQTKISRGEFFFFFFLKNQHFKGCIFMSLSLDSATQTADSYPFLTKAVPWLLRAKCQI